MANLSLSANERTPSAFITINKNRMKQYNLESKSFIIYMKDKTEFELELENPWDTECLVNIELNGKSFESGLVLKAKEHLFLDRFLESNKKFMFSTYTVEEQHERHEIKKNGKVSLSFHEPSVRYHWNKALSSTTMTQLPEFTISDDVTYENTKETGTIEEGSPSDQSFIETIESFNAFPNNTIEFKILPEFKKQITSKDIRNYCSDCGRRSKKGFNYCPTCGTKL
jgi:hypothetical protein